MDVSLCCLGLNTWTATFLVLVIIIFLLIRFKRKECGRLQEELNIPMVEGSFPLIGNIYQIIQKTFDEFENEWFRRKNSRIIGYWIGQSLAISVKDPQILKRVFVKDFSSFMDRPKASRASIQSPVNRGIFFVTGRDWKRIRSILSPTFSAGKLKIMNHDINRCSKNLADKIVELAASGESMTLKHVFGGYTLDTIAATAFGLDVDSFKDPDNSFLRNIKDIFTRGASSWRRRAFLIAAIFPSMSPVLRYFNINFFAAESVGHFVRECRAMIEDRKSELTESSARRADFLQLMLNAELEETQNGLSENGTMVGKMTAAEKHLTNEEVVGQAFLFFLAGYETTASTMSFLCYALACNQDIQDKVVSEITETLGEDEPSYENVGKLQYMEQVILETLRMYPPICRLNREVVEEVEINGIKFPRGLTVQIPLYTIHHSSEFWPEPEKFDPDRFVETKKTQNQFTFMPFGLGPRMCLGMRLATFEIKISLVRVLRKIKFVTCDETQIPLKVIPSSGLITVQDPIKLKCEMRSS